MKHTILTKAELDEVRLAISAKRSFIRIDVGNKNLAEVTELVSRWKEILRKSR